MLCCGKYVTLPTFGTIKKSEIFRNLDSCLTFSDMYSTYFVLIIYHFVIIYHLDTLTSIYNLIYTSKQTVVASVCIYKKYAWTLQNVKNNQFPEIFRYCKWTLKQNRISHHCLLYLTDNINSFLIVKLLPRSLLPECCSRTYFSGP